MLYHLAQLRDVFRPLNLFQYITFRAGGAALTALAASLLLGPGLISALRRKKVGQIQRTDGPQSHLSKQGTPTMGGALIFLSVSLSTVLWMRSDNRFTWLLLAVTICLTAIGFWDDYLKLVKKDAKGAPSRVKFLVQVAVGLAVASYLAVRPPDASFATAVNVPYGKELFVELGALYFVMATLMVVGSSNAVNLTDGLDGLAAGSVIFCALAYAVLAYVAGNVKFSYYLRIVHVEGAGEIAVYLAGLIGACLGFLWFNAYPAQIFMGDTGSLFLGGIIATVALCVKQELLLPIVGGVFVLETLSVILQMASYKLRRGKRVFRMAPIHHHFELGGVAEPKVTVRFWIVSIVLMLTALASLKIR
ncbi:MAG TPA: phospho-N-acetylmuramoyl-pentapeptide-transferase [Elusimicrobia bacterium]|nr:MAG: phospho-N-acetylmuramoyl-pentapeptide-transferase [Elusimicrobia bacterium GWA2_66_18]HAZ07216.1 phospho-N-acetylmuramoyl-pentapeptide-transferase [Elusimicrobiota bacterium]